MDTIEAVEYDFGLRLSIMLGQVWSQIGHQALSDLIKAERDLFKTWWRQGPSRCPYFFAALSLEYGRKTGGLEGNQGMSTPDDFWIKIRFRKSFSLLGNSAVLTKTAQQLYLHRNFSQYKIDKWEELTGLQLKELTDLDLVLSIDFTRYFKVLCKLHRTFFFLVILPQKNKAFSSIIKLSKDKRSLPHGRIES